LNNRTSKTLGVVAGAAAIALSLPLAATAYAEPPAPTPVAEIPDPQGPECGAIRAEMPELRSLAVMPVGRALSYIPEVSTFYSAISGGINPAVNIVPVLENGPYVIFAPTNAAFEALPEGQWEAIKSDPAALTKLGYYHAFLGLLGPDDVKGQRPTQDGAEVKVTGSGGDITVNDSAKVLCGDIQAANARIYIIDKVLDPADAPEPIKPRTSTATGAEGEGEDGASAVSNTTTTTTTAEESSAAGSTDAESGSETAES